MDKRGRVDIYCAHVLSSAHCCGKLALLGAGFRQMARMGDIGPRCLAFGLLDAALARDTESISPCLCC